MLDLKMRSSLGVRPQTERVAYYHVAMHEVTRHGLLLHIFWKHRWEEGRNGYSISDTNKLLGNTFYHCLTKETSEQRVSQPQLILQGSALLAE